MAAKISRMSQKRGERMVSIMLGLSFSEPRLVAVAATTSRLKKASLLQDYFARLSDADLALAARYLSGRAFPLNDQRVLGVGYAQVRDAILTLVPTPAEEYNRLPVQLGDMGEVA